MSPQRRARGRVRSYNAHKLVVFIVAGAPAKTPEKLLFLLDISIFSDAGVGVCPGSGRFHLGGVNAGLEVCHLLLELVNIGGFKFLGPIDFPAKAVNFRMECSCVFLKRKQAAERRISFFFVVLFGFFVLVFLLQDRRGTIERTAHGLELLQHHVDPLNCRTVTLFSLSKAADSSQQNHQTNDQYPVFTVRNHNLSTTRLHLAPRSTTVPLDPNRSAFYKLPRTEPAGSPPPKTAEPATIISAPASTTSAIFLLPIPPSISMLTFRRTIARSSAEVAALYPASAGNELLTAKSGIYRHRSTKSRPADALVQSVTSGVSGVDRDTRLPASFSDEVSVRCRWGPASTCTDTISAPASTNETAYRPGRRSSDEYRSSRSSSLSQRSDDGQADRDIRDKMAVHHVDVKHRSPRRALDRL